MARIAVIVLSGEDDDADRRGQLEQLGNQRETLIRTMRQGRQAEVDQGHFRQPAQLPDKLQAMRTRMAADDLEERAHRQPEAVTDQLIVIDDEQQRFFGQREGRRR
jgi:hypothetical protein